MGWGIRPRISIGEIIIIKYGLTFVKNIFKASLALFTHHICGKVL